MPKLEASEAAVADVEKNRVDLTNELEKAEQRRASLEKQLATTNGQINAIKTEIENKLELVSGRDAKIMQVTKELTHAKAKLSFALEQNTLLRSKITTIASRVQKELQRKKAILSLRNPEHKEHVYLDRSGIKFSTHIDQESAYTISVHFCEDFNPVHKQDSLAVVEFYDNNEALIQPPYSKLQTSEKVGAYQYLDPQQIKDQRFVFTVNSPKNASYMVLTLRTWKVGAEVSLKNRIEISKIDSELHLKEALLLVEDLPTALSSSDNNNTPEIITFERTPKPNQAVKRNKQLRAISLLDEFSHACWSPELVLYPLSRQNFRSQIQGSKSDFLFAESAWRANKASWEYAFTSPGLKHKNARDLQEALAIAKERDLATVFWNKEDPLHFERFLPIAQQFSAVFTTDASSIPRYKKALGNQNVFALPFAAQPSICNPADRFREEANSVCFAGSYFRENHDHRRVQMDRILPTICDFNGTIFDRMSSENNPKYAYPDRFRAFIKPKIGFDEMVRQYRRFKVFLNVNTITDSETMMARRVYELLASGTPVVSTPSLALERQFPGIVSIAETSEEANTAVSKLISDEQHWHKVSHIGYREVMNKHTYQHRQVEMSEKLLKAGILRGIEAARKPLVSLITATCRPHMSERLSNSITCQTHPYLEAIIITQGFSGRQCDHLMNLIKQKDRGNLTRVKIVPVDGDQSLGVRLNTAIEEASGDYIAKIDDDDFYFARYIEDSLLPFRYSDAKIVGKKEVYVWFDDAKIMGVRYSGQRHRHTDFVSGPTLIAEKSTFEKLPFSDRNRGEDSDLLSRARSNGMKVYAADPYNFIQFRSAPKNHTWQISETEFKDKCAIVDNKWRTDFVDF